MKKNWQSESLDMDQLFPGGYVIELETGRYLNNCNGKKIRSSPFDRAKHFPNRQQVKTYMDLHFPYIGFPIFICEVLWVLLSHRYELEGITEYWTGTGFSTQFQNAITFNTYKEAYGYQKTQCTALGRRSAAARNADWGVSRPHLSFLSKWKI